MGHINVYMYTNKNTKVVPGMMVITSDCCSERQNGLDHPVTYLIIACTKRTRDIENKYNLSKRAKHSWDITVMLLPSGIIKVWDNVTNLKTSTIFGVRAVKFNTFILDFD